MSQAHFEPSPNDHNLMPARDLIESLPGNSNMRQIELARLALKKARDEGEYAMLAQIEKVLMARVAEEFHLLTEFGLSAALELVRDLIMAHPKHTQPSAPNPAATPQPAPGQGSKVVLEFVLADIRQSLHALHHTIIEDLQDRAAEGLKKYGVMLEAHNGRDALMDAYQEALDMVMYAKQFELEENDAGDDSVWIKAPFEKALEAAAFIKYCFEIRVDRTENDDT